MLTGTRIVLRDYVAQDAAAIHGWRNDGPTTKWMGRRFRQPASLAEIQESLDRVIAGPTQRALFFAIADKVTLGYLGGIDLTDIDPTDRNAVLSLVIADAGNRGRGYASEAIQLLLGHAFHEMHLHKVSLNVFEANEPAYRCYLKNGFRAEGRIRDHLVVDGEYRDLIPMGILESEFGRPGQERTRSRN